jgi:hypothetical protein
MTDTDITVAQDDDDDGFCDSYETTVQFMVAYKGQNLFGEEREAFCALIAPDQPDAFGGTQDHFPTTLIDGDDIIDARESIEIRFSYPLRSAHVFTFERPGGWTRQAFYDAVRAKYQEIYDTEERTRTASAGQLAPEIINRSKTDGVYGIWGHVIGDLVLEGAEIGADGVWQLDIGS